MKDKEKIIIENAIKLFAQKGFSATSIQEIATESGISKGAFYLYFKSKDSLLVAILNYYFNLLQNTIKLYKERDLPPREKFTQQLIASFETLLQHKEFIIMQTREQAIPLNEEVKGLIFKMHAETNLFYREGLKSIYGEKVEQHLWDLSFILDGIIQPYVRLLLFDKNQLDLEELFLFIMRRMDSIVEGITEEKPLLTGGKLKNLLEQTKSFFLTDTKTIENTIDSLERAIKTIKDNDALEVSLEVLVAEIKRETPRIPVIQGMLSNFRGIPEVNEYTNDIAEFFNIKHT